MAHSLKPIEEQVIVITGASSGIGLATAVAAAQQGASVVLNARNEVTLRELVRRIRESGGTAVYAAGDIGDPGVPSRIARAAIDHFDRIDTWINNAGVSIYGRITQATDDDNRRLFDTNFWGVVYGSLTALPHLKQSRGALINVGSEVSEAVVPLQGMYSASKHAVKGFTDALRVELRHDDVPVSVTLIEPGATDTPFPQHARNYMDREPALPKPLDDPYDVADAILGAATSNKRTVRVSSRAKLDAAMARFAPPLAERMAAKQMDNQRYDEPPRHAQGTLYEPGGEGMAYGRGGQREEK